MPRRPNTPKAWALLGVVLIVGVMPLAASPFGTDGTTASRLLVLALGLALALMTPATGRLPRPISWSLVGAVLVMVITALAAPDPALSLIGRFPRYEGVLTVSGLALALVVGSRTLGVESSRARQAVGAALAFASVMNAVVSLGQLLVAPDQRVVGLLANSSVLGTFGAVALALLAGSGWRARQAWLAWAGAGGAAVFLVLSASRGALVAVAVAAVALAGWRAWTRQGWRHWTVPLAGALAVVLATLLIPTGRARLTGVAPFAEATVSGRLLLWQESWQLWLANPWLGVGPSGFVDRIGAFHTGQWAAAVGPFAPPDSPHNFVLQVLASTGVLGLAAVVAVAATIVLAVARGPRKPKVPQPGRSGSATAALVAAVSAAAALATATAFAPTDPSTLTLVGLTLGGALARPGGDAGRIDVARWVGLAFAAGLATLSLGVLAGEARYSAALGSPTPGPALVDAAGGWDPDLDRRIGYSLNRMAEQNKADPNFGVDVLTPVCARLSRSVECLHALADAQTLAGDPGAALRTLDRAFPFDPVNVDTYLKRGIALAELGHHPEAEAALLTARDLRPSAPEPWSNLAQLYRLQGRTAEAAAAQTRADQLRVR